MRAAAQVIAEAKKLAKSRLDREARFRGDPYSRTDIAKWNSASKRERDMIEQIFIDEYGGTNISDQRDRYFTLSDGTRVNVMAWAASSVKGQEIE